jgi:putative endonuclease
MPTAIGREKQLKAGSRFKKLALIERTNPTWRDLYDDII